MALVNDIVQCLRNKFVEIILNHFDHVSIYRHNGYQSIERSFYNVKDYTLLTMKHLHVQSNSTCGQHIVRSDRALAQIDLALHLSQSSHIRFQQNFCKTVSSLILIQGCAYLSLTNDYLNQNKMNARTSMLIFSRTRHNMQMLL